MSKVNSSIKFKLLVITVFVMLCSGFKLLAAETYTDLTLTDAVKIGLKNNIQQRISLQAAAIAESQYQEALSARWPTVSLQASATRMGEDPTFILPSTTISIASLATPLNGLLGG